MSSVYFLAGKGVDARDLHHNSIATTKRLAGGQVPIRLAQELHN